MPVCVMDFDLNHYPGFDIERQFTVRGKSKREEHAKLAVNAYPAKLEALACRQVLDPANCATRFEAVRYRSNLPVVHIRGHRKHDDLSEVIDREADAS